MSSRACGGWHIRLRKDNACLFAHHQSHEQIKPFMNKGERISRFVAELSGKDLDPGKIEVASHPYYRAYFQCWNEQRYYEAHDVLELQKNFVHPTHAKHSRRLPPAVRLFRLAEKNLSAFAPRHHGLDVAALCGLLRAYTDQIVASDYITNPWSPETAPKLKLL